MSLSLTVGLGLGLGLCACSIPDATFKPLSDGSIDSATTIDDSGVLDDAHVQIDAAIGPAVASVDQPPRIATGDTVPIKVGIHGVKPGSVMWTVAATNGTFTPTTGTADLDASGNGTFNISYKASIAAGDDAWSVDLDDGTPTHTSFVAKVAALTPIGQATSFADHAGMTVTSNTLYGQKVTLAAQAYVMRLGLFTDNASATARMALYLDQAANPALLVAQVGPQALVVGANELRLTAPVQLNAGTYWLMADFDAGTQVRRNATTVAQIFLSVAATAPLPATTAGSTSLSGNTLNYFAEIIP